MKCQQSVIYLLPPLRPKPTTDLVLAFVATFQQTTKSNSLECLIVSYIFKCTYYYRQVFINCSYCQDVVSNKTCYWLAVFRLLVGCQIQQILSKQPTSNNQQTNVNLYIFRFLLVGQFEQDLLFVYLLLPSGCCFYLLLI